MDERPWWVGVTCILGPIIVERVHSAAPGHWVRGVETGYLGILGTSEKVEVWCNLESVAGVMEYLGVQRNFFVGFEVRGIRRNKDVDARLLLFSVRGFVGYLSLVEESLVLVQNRMSYLQFF